MKAPRRGQQKRGDKVKTLRGKAMQAIVTERNICKSL